MVEKNYFIITRDKGLRKKFLLDKSAFLEVISTAFEILLIR